MSTCVSDLCGSALTHVPRGKLARGDISNLSRRRYGRVTHCRLSTVVGSCIRRLDGTDNGRVDAVLGAPFVSGLSSSNIMHLGGRTRIASCSRRVAGNCIRIVGGVVPHAARHLPRILREGPRFAVFCRTLIGYNLSSLLLRSGGLGTSNSPEACRLSGGTTHPNCSSRNPFRIPSRYGVGFAVFTRSGTAFTGCNVRSFTDLGTGYIR